MTEPEERKRREALANSLSKLAALSTSETWHAFVALEVKRFQKTGRLPDYIKIDTNQSTK
jgi:hypothetical protein